MFDANPRLTGIRIKDIEIKDVDSMKGFLDENHIDIAIICVPDNSAQKVCDELVANGVKGIWNFAPVDLVAPKDVIVENVHLSESLLTLAYLINESQN
jgi:redox-sensing transcriptional repressor